jgi:hypothetical protein
MSIHDPMSYRGGGVVFCLEGDGEMSLRLLLILSGGHSSLAV